MSGRDWKLVKVVVYPPGGAKQAPDGADGAAPV